MSAFDDKPVDAMQKVLFSDSKTGPGQKEIALQFLLFEMPCKSTACQQAPKSGALFPMVKHSVHHGVPGCRQAMRTLVVVLHFSLLPGMGSFSMVNAL